jgi:hypothetical protein
LTCHLRPATTSDPDLFQTTFTAEWGQLAGGRITAETAGPDTSGTAFRISTEEPTQAWAYASWAVAKADELGIETVAVGSRLWQRSTGEWTDASPPQPAGGEQVLVTLK